jgi:hypothetical protein
MFLIILTLIATISLICVLNVNPLFFINHLAKLTLPLLMGILVIAINANRLLNIVEEEIKKNHIDKCGFQI